MRRWATPPVSHRRHLALVSKTAGIARLSARRPSENYPHAVAARTFVFRVVANFREKRQFDTVNFHVHMRPADVLAAAYLPAVRANIT
jgi:hypothetical protein